MAHPYSGHREAAVGHRRAKLMTTGKQYARGGHTDEAEDKKLIKREIKKAEDKEAKVEGKAAGGRLDKRARGGAVKGYQMGGGIRKLTPSKHKPHTAVHITNISRGGGGGGGAGLPRPRLGLPPIAPPMAPPMGGALPPLRPPMGPAGVPPMKRGGRAKGGAAVIRYAAGGRMRSGKKFGEGSGSGRLEEYKHMRK